MSDEETKVDATTPVVEAPAEETTHVAETPEVEAPAEEHTA